MCKAPPASQARPPPQNGEAFTRAKPAQKGAPRSGELAAKQAGGTFPAFHTVFHMRVENSYFSTDYNRLYRGCKSPAANNI